MIGSAVTNLFPPGSEMALGSFSNERRSIMLRSDRNVIEDYMRGANGRATLPEMKRGKFFMDSADLAASEVDGALVGGFLGIPIFRKASLVNGIFEYYDDAGNLLLTNA